MKMTDPKTLVVILNYRTPDLTIQCLKSLEPEINPQLTVHLVDNNSNDGSVEKIQKAIDQNHWQNWLQFTRNPTNDGFSAGNNIAIRQALEEQDPPKYILLLNSDTIVLPGAIHALVQFMENHPKAGIAGSWLEGLDKLPQNAAFRFPTFYSELDNGFRWGYLSKKLENHTVAMPILDQPHKAEWVAGASFMIRTEVFRQVGLMDEHYFLYYEELDFAKQANKAGWECWFVPTSKVIHLVGQSTFVSNTQMKPKRRPTYWFESRRRYFQKNHGLLYSMATDIGWMTGYAVWRIRRIFQQKPDTDPPHLLWDFFKNSSLFHFLQP